jgi:GT2 family glycosyltransferase
VAESRCVQSFQVALEQDPSVAGHLLICVYDNSPEPESVSNGIFPCDSLWFQPRKNNGLAHAYNCVLAVAQERGIPWLLLLDSDTEVTLPYLRSCLSQSERAEECVAALVPHTVEGTTIHSPRYATAFRRRAAPVSFSGLADSELIALNSGTVLRVNAITSIGGFDTRFWLDYLDYWLFRSLHRAGWKLFVLPDTLQHSLSWADPIARMPLWRYRNMLAAESYFTTQYGSIWERIRLRLVLVKRTVQFAIRTPDRAFLRLTIEYLLLGTSAYGKRVKQDT